jgi:hypothetical protein
MKYNMVSNSTMVWTLATLLLFASLSLPSPVNPASLQTYINSLTPAQLQLVLKAYVEN